MAPSSPAAPVHVRFEHHEAGALGIGERSPRLSWSVPEAPAGYQQARYQVEGEVMSADGSSRPVHAVVDSAEQVLVPWPSAPLRSRDAVRLRVRVEGAGEDAAWSPWSEWATTELGLLEATDWVARMVGPAEPEPAEAPDAAARGLRRPPLVRTELTVDQPVRSARLYVTAHGLVEVEIDGARVGRDELVPGWTSYTHRLRYLTYDVTDLLGAAGPHAIGARLADGWYRGHIGFEGGTHDNFGSDIGLLAQLELVLADGTRQTVATGPGWRTSVGELISTGLYEGEHHDERLGVPGWSRPGFDDTAWAPVQIAEVDLATLAAPDGPPVRCTDELRPVSVDRRPDGRLLLDFGQNHAGRLRIRPHGPAGTTIRLRHAEVLEDGELCTRPLRGAAATDVLVLGDDGPGEWEPRFTIHGYRYAEITGWVGDFGPDDVVSRVLHTDMERTGWFRCSEPDVERLHENVVWSLRSNFVDIPTDCPQRDERLGWTGDIQVFAPTASFLYDTAGMLAEWLRSVSAEQQQYGTVPWYVPFIPGGHWWDPTKPGAVWGDVAALTPWVLHERFADRDLLARQYPSAKAWVEQVEALAGPGRVWDQNLQLGDWLDPTAPPENPLQARTDPHLVATAYFARSARVLARSAAVLGLGEDAARFGSLADEVQAAFAARYVDADGHVAGDTQTGHALALVFDLLPDEATRESAAARLAALVEESGGTIATGFAGTPVVCDALSAAGAVASAYRLLLERRCPSWLYPVTMGATTTWERWDSLLPDGTVNPGDMTSFNHYALGAVADWLHRVVAGLAPDAPGYRRLRLAPRPGGGLTHAGATHLTPYGTASVDWQVTAGRFVLHAVVPVGTTAVLDLPGQPPRTLGHGEHTLDLPVDTVVA
ncbi:glycoside hydrolase family 78 protein [Cellulomonas soli]|uniref:glycoside hydrolase family 78 protein n=1 Tax=Cellulomonas soli TaxID=931535 RepID=UPI003F82D2EB